MTSGVVNRSSSLSAMTTIRPMTPADWPAVRRVYEEGIATGDATFKAEAPDWRSWDDDHLPACRLVAEKAGEVLGWAALSEVSGRCVYGGVAAVSVYVTAAARGAGVGRALLEALVEVSEEADLWTLEAGIFPENEASLRLAEAAGFRVVGTRERLGRLGDDWRDVVLVERRSRIAGV